MAVIAFQPYAPISNPGPVPDLARHGVLITKSDADTFDRPARVWVGGAGNVVCTPAGRTSAGGVMANCTVPVAAGQYIPFLCIAVLSTNTTATSMFAIY